MRDPNDVRYFTRDGVLRDYIPRPGDPVPPGGIAPSADRWAGVALLKNFGEVGAARRTLIDTGDLGETADLDVRLLFAFDSNNSRVQPVMPWDPVYRGDGTIRVSIRRGLDTLSNVVEETTDILGPVDLAPFGEGDQFGIDVVQARNLSVSVEFTHGLSDIWVQAVATRVHDIGTRDRIVGWQRPEMRTIAAANAPTQLAKSRPGRVQFIIANTSLNANLFIGKDAGVSATNAMIVLPSNIFAQYESPVGGYRGPLFGFWDNAAANGNALVTEGFYF